MCEQGGKVTRLAEAQMNEKGETENDEKAMNKASHGRKTKQNKINAEVMDERRTKSRR